MRQRAAKAALLIIEVAAVVVAAFTAGAVYVYWRLQQGPLSLGFFRHSAESAIERRLANGFAVNIGALELVQRDEKVRLRLSELEIFEQTGDVSIGADVVDLVFSTGDILSGSIGPQLIDASGAQFRIVRNADQDFQIPASRVRSGADVFPDRAFSFNQGVLKSAFQRAEIKDAIVTFLDEASGRSWISQNATVVLARSTDGLSGRLSGDIDLGSAFASIKATAQYTEEDGVIAVDIAGADFPVGDMLTTFYGDRAGIVNAPVSGAASIVLSRDGDVQSSSFDARVGEGSLVISGATAPIRFVNWKAKFDPQSNQFSINSLDYDIGGNRGSITGAVSLEFGDDVRDPSRIMFDLQGEDVVAAVSGRLPEPLPIASIAAAGTYDVKTRKLDLSDVSAALLDIEILGAFSFMSPRSAADGAALSPEVTAALRVDGELDPQRLLRIWPLGVAMGARDWIEARMMAARISDINAEMNLAAGAVGPQGGMPDEAMTITFDVAEADALYVLGMTPLKGASGSGILKGNSFKLTADLATVGDVQISDGEVSIPVFIPKWQPAYYRFTATGRSEAMLNVLDEDPLNLLSKTNLRPEQFKGDARARIEIMRPNKRHVEPDEYEYRGTADFKAMTIAGFAGDAELTDGAGSVTLQPRSLTVEADAKLTDAPINLVWERNFFAQDGPSAFSISGIVDAGVGDLFGWSIRQYVRGPVAATAKAIGDFGAFRSLTISADFKDAGMSIDLLGWSKEPGAPATGEIDLRFDEDTIEVSRVAAAGDGVAINGAFAIENGALSAAAFPMFYLKNAADMSIAATRAAGGELDLTLTGAFFNAGPSILHFTKGAGASARTDADADPWGRGLVLTARLDELELRKNVAYRDAAFDLWRDGSTLQALDFSALGDDGAPLTLSLAQMGSDVGPERQLTARSSNLGGFLKGVMGFSSLEGGEGSMALRFGGEDAAGLTGEIEARGLHVVNAPLLARIFSAGSLDGLANLVQGEGIDLTYAYGQFDYGRDMLTLRNFRATGPSVGMTAEGDISFAQGGQIAMSGALAPVYQLNSALGAAPILGDILVGKEGEGVLALSYSVNGQRAAPNVFVNPLSALTPGVFRQLFRPEAPALENPEDAAVSEPG